MSSKEVEQVVKRRVKVCDYCHKDTDGRMFHTFVFENETFDIHDDCLRNLIKNHMENNNVTE